MPIIQGGHLEVQTGKTAGVVDEDVQTPESVRGQRDSRTPVIFTRHIKVNESRSTAKCGRRFLPPLVQNVADHHFGTSLRHEPCGLRTYAAGRARYQGNFAVQSVHWVGPPQVSRCFSNRLANVPPRSWTDP